MVEEKLLDHVISRLEPQLLDCVGVRHPPTTSSLLQIIGKYEDRFLNRMTRGSSQKFRNATHSVSNQFPNKNKQENWWDTRVNRYTDNSRPQRESNRFGGQGVVDNRRYDSRRRSGQSDHRFNNQGGRQGVSRNGAFRSQNSLDRISSLRMTPVDLPYVPILLNETFITALWDTGVEKSFISEELYRKYFSYGPRQKTKDRVVTAQGAPCYFDKKSLVIPDEKIKPLPIEKKPVEVDISDTKLGEGQKQKLHDLFNSFKGLFSDQPGLTHVLYHEIETGDKGLVVSRPYRYDRVKQGIIDYHIEKMLHEGKIQPIQSPYALPVVLMRKNNGLPPDST
ncbi:uncharacterized protein TNCV_2488031 [Trichonephila clavipes]|nr:uncharacterized protein TNCV_2488031 [Trichonephila clavipes]